MLVRKRSRITSFALVAVLSVAAFVIPASTAQAATTTTISEAVTPSVITYGSVQSITGRLAKASTRASLANMGVTIQRRLNGSTTWTNWLNTKTNAAGYYKAAYQPSRSYTYRARFAGTRIYSPITSAIRLGAVKPKVSATLAPSSRSLTVGDVASYAGTVAPRISTQRVLVQEVVAGKWLTVASTAPNALGKYSVSWRPTKAGRHTYRLAVTSGTPALATGYSANAGITAFRWLYLADMIPKSSFLSGSEPVSINGQFFAHSKIFARNNTFDGAVSYDFKRKCRRFVTTAGVPDTNPITGTTLMEIYHDGNLASAQLLSGGNSYMISQDVTDILEFKVVRNYTNSAYHDLALGNARVLCLF